MSSGQQEDPGRSAKQRLERRRKPARIVNAAKFTRRRSFERRGVITLDEQRLSAASGVV
jgi:hypothetical protein